MNKILLVIWILATVTISNALDENFWAYKNWYKPISLFVFIMAPFIFLHFQKRREIKK